MFAGMSEVERHVPVRGGISLPALPLATFFLRICFCFGFAIESEDEMEVAEVAELLPQSELSPSDESDNDESGGESTTFFLRICFCLGFEFESEDKLAKVAELSLSELSLSDESDNRWSEGNKYLGGLTKEVSPLKRDANRVIGPEEVEGCGFLRDPNRVIGPEEVEG